MTAKEIGSILLKENWRLVDIKASHYQYKYFDKIKNVYDEKRGKVTVPFHTKPKDLNIKTIRSIFKQAQIDVHKYI